MKANAWHLPRSWHRAKHLMKSVASDLGHDEIHARGNIPKRDRRFLFGPNRLICLVRAMLRMNGNEDDACSRRICDEMDSASDDFLRRLSGRDGVRIRVGGR